MFNTIIGFCLGLYGIYGMYVNTEDLTIQFYLKYGAMIAIGFGVVLYNQIPVIYNIITNFKNTLIKKEVVMTRELSKDIHMKTEEEQDLASVFYLTERLKDMPEGLELCAKLNAILFDLHHPIKKG